MRSSLCIERTALVQNLLLFLCRCSSDILQTLSSSSSTGISGSASSQWQVLQMLFDESQLVSLLGTGDFVALPLGPRPHEANQVAAAAAAWLAGCIYGPKHTGSTYRPPLLLQ